MSQNEPKINPATGYVHDDSQLEEQPAEPIVPEVIEPEQPAEEEHKEAAE